MGIFNLFSKAKGAISDYKQMVAEVAEEAKTWRELDPHMLRAIIDGDNSKARDIYAANTGASANKARMFVNEIKAEVNAQYPGILCGQAMNAIRNVWPEGSKKIFAINADGDDGFGIGCVWIDADIDANYTFHIEFSSLRKAYTFIVAGEKLILKNKDGGISDISDRKFEDINFNPSDDEYIKCKRIYDDLTSINEFEMYDSKEIEKVRKGEMSADLLIAAGTKYKLSFAKEADEMFWTTLKTENYNIAQEFLDSYFRFFYYTHESNGNELNPWETSIFITAVNNSNGFFGYDLQKYRKNYLELLNAEEEKSRSGEFVYFAPANVRGFTETDQDNRTVESDYWKQCVKAVESINEFFNSKIEGSYFTIRPTCIIYGEDGNRMYFDFDIKGELDFYFEQSLKKAMAGLPSSDGKSLGSMLCLEKTSNNNICINLYMPASFKEFSNLNMA